MVEAVVPCPATDDLREYAAGTLDPARRAAMADHVRSCSACRESTERMRADETLSQQLREALDLEPQALLRRSLQEQLSGDFEILAVLGRGASGVVFEARDLKLGRRVAIKCLHAAAGKGASDDALREARHLATITHPNIAAVYTVSEIPSLPFIVMEFVDGVPIVEALADRPIDQQIDAFRQVLRAVSELHRRGMVHRDLKPANILIDRRGSVKLVDFGIARQAASASTRVQGTPAYVAPEQSFGQEPSPLADVFSLGVILFELLTGQRPFPGKSTTQILTAVRQTNPPLPRSLRPEIPGALQAICLTALEKDPALRYPSAREFLLDLERFINGEPVAANPTLLASILDHGIERHLGDLRRWQSDRMISTRECDYFLSKYDRLRQREEFWVLDSRRFTFSQVMLRLGAGSCVLSVALMLLFDWIDLSTPRPLLPTIVFTILLSAGLYLWRAPTKRVAIVLLIAANTACPFTVGTLLVYHHLFVGNDANKLFPQFSNPQFLVAFTCMLILALLLWYRTKNSAFTLMSGLSTIGFSTAIFSLMDLKHLILNSPDVVGGWYLWPGTILLGLAIYFDLWGGREDFAVPLYVIGVTVVLIAITIIACFGPTPQWLGVMQIDRGDDDLRFKLIKYSLLFNGLLIAFAGFVAERSAASSNLRRLGMFLLWLAPSHILIPIFHLRFEWPIGHSGWHVPELVLPVLALGLVFASVPKQMKSFFFSGLAYSALAAYELTHEHFKNQFRWPVGLAVAGFILGLAAWRYPAIFDRKPRAESRPAKVRG